MFVINSIFYSKLRRFCKTTRLLQGIFYLTVILSSAILQSDKVWLLH